jgi:hypothetical protein
MKSRRLRRIALGIILGVGLGFAGAFAILLASRKEQLPEITYESLDANQARWGENGPKSYDLDLQLAGINPGSVHVEVRAGEATAMTYNGRPSKLSTADYWWVPGLFEVIRRDLEACAEAAQKGSRDATTPIFSRGLFDPRYGYPTAYRRITPTGMDAEWQVVGFTPK